MAKQLNLEEAVDHINLWRQSRKGQRGRIPEYMWRNAVSLSKIHTAKVVAKQLNLKLSDLESKIRDPSRSLQHAKTAVKKSAKGSGQLPSLVEVPISHPNIDRKCILELELNNGAKVKIYQ